MLLAASFVPAQQPGRGQPRAAEHEPAAAPSTPLGQAATQVLARAFADAENWSMRAIVLLSFGSDWHPDGVACVLDALRAKDERLVPYGVEVLRGTTDEALQQVATTELLDELIGRQLKRKNELLQRRVLEVLARAVPAAAAKDRRGWEEWWRGAKATWAPPAWTPPPSSAHGPGTVAGTVVERAFDLRDAGLDVAIVIDSTGSMQVAIDAARDAIDDVVALLAGIAPKLRLGLVHYKDFGDLGDGAQMLVALTKEQQEVRDKLARLTASGGGDVPERIESGFAVAVRKEMGWSKDANRLILVIGDAPPHADVAEQLYETIRNARLHPGAEPGKAPVTGAPAKKAPRPFITSAIATNAAPKAEFERIAEAGGGTCVVLGIGGTPGRGGDGGGGGAGGAGRGGEGRGGKGGERGAGPAQPAPTSAQTATQRLVEHVMLLSFGARHRAELQRFVRTFFEFRDAGFFR